MPQFIYNKLVRDNIPEWHNEEGHTVNGRQLAGDELKKALHAKLVEEALEVPVDSIASASLKEELADVLQVINDIARIYDISLDEVEGIRQEKLHKKGGFYSGYFIEDITMPIEDTWVENCRAQPDKYPEVR